MSKTPQRPQAGGSYTRDSKTGKLTRTGFTAPAPSRSEVAAEAAKAEAATSTDGDKPNDKGALTDG